MSDLTAVFLAVALLLGNAFFVGAEFALVSARRSQVEPRAQQGSRVARTTLRAMENMPLVIGVNQLGITVCSLLLGAVGEPAVSHLVEPLLHVLRVPDALLHPISFAVALGVVASLHVVIGEMVPKNIALAGPDRAAMALAVPLWGLVSVLRPVIVAINAVAGMVLRLVGVRLESEVSSTYTREEVAGLVEQSRGEGLLAEEEYGRLSGALGFTEKTVEAVVMPPESLATVPSTATPAEVEQRCATTGFSRFPVTDPDGLLLGYLHIKDVLETDDARRHRAVDPGLVRPLAVVGRDVPLHDALATLQRAGAHLARVEDGAGASLGLVTLEDVLEELVGVIRDAAHLGDS